MAETPRAQLIHIDVDRRLGHEWDEWDGKPLPNQGNYDSPPALFFAWSAAGPRRRSRPSWRSPSSCSPPGSPTLHARLPPLLWSALAAAAVAALGLVGRALALL